MKIQPELSSTRFRKIFGFLFPFFYTVLLLAIFIWAYNQEQQETAKEKKAIWKEKANLLIASLQGTHKFEHIIRDSGNRLALALESTQIPEIHHHHFKTLYKHYFNFNFMQNSLTWVFSLKKNKAKCLKLKGFEYRPKYILEKVFEALVQFATDQKMPSSQIRSLEKTVKNVFGNWSAPLFLGSKREGMLTPVNYSGKNYYLYWRKFMVAEKTFAGMIILIPEKNLINDLSALKILATRIYKKSRKRLACAFIPSKNTIEPEKIILPEIPDAKPDEIKKVTQLLTRLKKTPSSFEGQLQFIDQMVFLRSLFAINSSYDAVIFSPVPDEFIPVQVEYSRIIIWAAVFWLIVFLWLGFKSDTSGIPLWLAFRLLLIFSGLIPIALMLMVGNRFINQVYQAEILDLKQKNITKLRNLDERSDMLKPLFGRNIQQLLNKKEIQNLLRTKKITELEEVFNIFSNALSQKQLTLSYLFAYAPNEKSESYLADIRNHNQASILEDFYSIAVYETHKDIDPFGKIPLPVLSKTQKQWLKPLQNFGNRDFVKNLFIDALEQEVFFNLGGENKNYFYSTIVLDHGKINKYLVFGSINEITFRNFLRNEIDSINTEDSTIFLAAEKRDNSDFTIFPFKKMNVLNSSMGKAAFNFIKLCRDSIFTRHMIGKDHIFVYYPLKDMNKYACGCIIDLTEPNLELQQKKLFLYSFGAVLILILYFITAFAVNYIFQPIDQVSAALKHIAGGSFDIKLASKRKDEIGDLIRTLEIMVKGFKKRLKLGKYVSGTLDKTIHQLADKNKAKPTKKIQGTILFSDIRSFTTLSENNSPEKVSEMLNNHLQAMSQIIQKFSGDIEQFIGDAVIALFTGPDSKELALNAAIQMRKVHNSIIESRKTQNQFIYEIGIGIETGQLITTSVTTPSRAEFIVIGSARTSAEKYESESRHGSHSRIIVSKNFLETRIDFANLVKLPGTELYEVNF